MQHNTKANITLSDHKLAWVTINYPESLQTSLSSPEFMGKFIKCQQISCLSSGSHNVENIIQNLKYNKISKQLVPDLT